MTVSLVTLAFTIIIAGVLLYLAREFIPMDPKIHRLLQIVVVLCLVIYVLQAFGLLGEVGHIRLLR